MSAFELTAIIRYYIIAYSAYLLSVPTWRQLRTCFFNPSVAMVFFKTYVAIGER